MPNEPCPSCNGQRGEWEDAEAMDWVDCPDCAGTGKAANSITANEAQPLRLTLAEAQAEARARGCQIRFCFEHDDGRRLFADEWEAGMSHLLDPHGLVTVVARDDTTELVEALERIANPRNFGEQSEAKSIARAALARVKGEHS